MSASHRVKTTLCNTSLDNPTQRNKDQLIRAAVKFLDTDTICYRVEEPETLVELQRNEWDPIIEWAEKSFLKPPLKPATCVQVPALPLLPASLGPASLTCRTPASCLLVP
uniref:cDNA FLJ51223, moderately similar to ATP synthase mitochondrial F1 complex assembly factor 2, mitochondrial n=1 Tax=Homo sapiens TaxID=9606 RepID=B7Z3V0_HUMAN|nr:unnamed protein product [Homo sapiens]